MQKYDPRVEEAIVEGQPIFLVGTDPVVLAHRLNELCRRHVKEKPYWVATARDRTAFREIELGEFLPASSGPMQTQAVISALRQDPDGLIAAPLFADASETYLRALLSGHNYAVYATLEYPTVADALTAWRAAGCPDEVLAQALDDILFIEWHGSEFRYLEAELLDGLLDIWEPEGLEAPPPKLRLVKEDVDSAMDPGVTPILPRIPKGPATMTPSAATLAGVVTAGRQGTRLSSSEVSLWVQERSRGDLRALVPHGRAAFIPLTEPILPEEHFQFVSYARATGRGELLLQLQSEQVPPTWERRPAPGTYLQLFALHRDGRREFHVMTVTEEERRRAPVGFPSGSFLRGRFRVKRWLEIQDFPHPSEYSRLGISAKVTVSGCAPFTKLGGWPAWENGPMAADPMLLQIDAEAHEFELALGTSSRSFIFQAESQAHAIEITPSSFS